MSELLRVPETMRSVDDLLATAKHLDLPNAILISELPGGELVFLQTEMSSASANWLIDRLKMLLLMPGSFERVGR